MTHARTLAMLAVLIAWPAHSRAQWTVAAYAGGAHTRPAALTVAVPASAAGVTLPPVAWRSESLASPIYYGYRIGYLFGPERRVGIEVEFTHAKVFMEHPSGVIQRLAMSHGVNFVLGNLVIGRGLGADPRRPRVRLDARAGAGVTIPHVEAQVGDQARDQYQYGGPGAQLAGGVSIRLAAPLYLLAEYKLTLAREHVSIPDGFARATFQTHHAVLGLVVCLP